MAGSAPVAIQQQWAVAVSHSPNANEAPIGASFVDHAISGTQALRSAVVTD